MIETILPHQYATNVNIPSTIQFHKGRYDLLLLSFLFFPVVRFGKLSARKHFATFLFLHLLLKIMNMSIHAAEDVVAKILSEHVEASKCHTEMTGTIFILFDVRSRKKSRADIDNRLHNNLETN